MRTKAEARSELHEKELEVERQNLGLVPRAINPERWTVADLMRWWLDTYSRHQAAHESNEGTVRCHILGAPIAAKLLEHVRPGDVEQLLQAKEGQLSPGTINHIRQFLVRAFNNVRKAGRWHGGNPAEDVDTRRVPALLLLNVPVGRNGADPPARRLCPSPAGPRVSGTYFLGGLLSLPPPEGLPVVLGLPAPPLPPWPPFPPPLFPLPPPEPLPLPDFPMTSSAQSDSTSSEVVRGLRCPSVGRGRRILCRALTAPVNH